jgi:hypothetical protein
MKKTGSEKRRSHRINAAEIYLFLCRKAENLPGNDSVSGNKNCIFTCKKIHNLYKSLRSTDN